MLPALIGAGLGLVTDLVGTAVSASNTRKANEKSEAFSREMYDKQKADNLAFWNTNNAYNSPEQQMARLSKAGLNPNLVYGNGAVANSASAPDAPHAQPFRAEAPRFNLPNLQDSYFNIQTQQQQLNNQKQIGNNLALDALLKTQDVQTKSMANTWMSDHGYSYKTDQGRNATNLLYEKYLAQNALNAFNFGGDLNDANGIGHIDKNSAYSLQAQNLALGNKLRGQESKSKSQNYDINEIRRKYTKRTMSGEISDMSAKDVLQLLLGAGNLFKK